MATWTAIVAEGGGMRGVFSAGVLDGLLELGLVDFDLAIGTSAGACNLASFVARQHGRSFRCYVNIMAHPRAFSLRRALLGGHYMDLDWLWDECKRTDPLDESAIAGARTHLVFVSTCARTGASVYHTARTNIHNNLKAGCALPILYRGPVPLESGRLVVDGGLVDPIPARQAYLRGARRILVIRTRPSKVVKRDHPLTRPVTAVLLRSAALSYASSAAARRYREAVAFVHTPPRDAQILEIAPPKLLQTKRTTQDITALRADYALGRELAHRRSAEIADLLDSSIPTMGVAVQ